MTAVAGYRAGPLLGGDTRVITLGLELFAHTCAAAGVPVVHVDWRPPAGGDPRLADLLSRVTDDTPCGSAPSST